MKHIVTTIAFFACLNTTLYLITDSAHTNAVPIRDVIASFIAFLLVLVTVRARIYRQVTLEKNAAFKRYFPMLSLSELIMFLIIPWALLLSYRGTSVHVPWLVSSHLFVVQSQVGIETLLTSHKRHGALFCFIVLSNIYRAVALATGIVRYIELRDDLLPAAASSDLLVQFLDIYTVLAVQVYMSSNAIIAFLWYPLLKYGDDLTAGGLRTYKGSVCIITGAASGIGKEMAKDLGKRGAHAIVLIDRQVALANEVSAELQNLGVESSVHSADVRDFDAVKRVVEETREKYGRLDYMINNAGILCIGPIEKIGVATFDYILDVNVRGVHHGVQSAYPIMKSQGFGHIVNVSSLLGLIPGGTWAVAYSASKHAVVGLSTNLRIEAAKFGIRVSCFCPGTIETPIHTGGEFGKNLTGIPKEVWNAQIAKMKAMDAKECASKALDDIASNKALFVVPNKPMLKARLLYRLSPSLWLYTKVNRVDWRRTLTKSVAKAEVK